MVMMMVACLYIYISRERERERERALFPALERSHCAFVMACDSTEMSDCRFL